MVESNNADLTDFSSSLVKIWREFCAGKMAYYAIPLVAITFEHGPILKVQWREL